MSRGVWADSARLARSILVTHYYLPNASPILPKLILMSDKCVNIYMLQVEELLYYWPYLRFSQASIAYFIEG